MSVCMYCGDYSKQLFLYFWKESQNLLQSLPLINLFYVPKSKIILTYVRAIVGFQIINYDC